jgi:hypothetical protein
MRASGRYLHRSLNSARELRLPSLLYVDPVMARAFRTAEVRSLAVRIFSKMLRTLRGAMHAATRRSIDGLPLA